MDTENSFYVWEYFDLQYLYYLNLQPQPWLTAKKWIKLWFALSSSYKPGLIPLNRTLRFRWLVSKQTKSDLKKHEQRTKAY